MKNIKRKAAALIAAAMLITSAGCADSGSPAESRTESVSALAYRGTEAVIDGIKGTIMSFSFNNGRVYTVSTEYPSGEIADDEKQLWHISSFNADGSDFRSQSTNADYMTSVVFDSSGEPWVAFDEYGDTHSEKLILKKLDADCNFTEKRDISAIITELGDGTYYLNRIAFDKEDNIYMLFSDKLGVSDSSGKPLFTAETDQNSYFRLVKDSGGVPYLYNINYSGAFDLYEIDLTEKQIKEKNSYSVEEGIYTTNILAEGYGGSDLYWCDFDAVYSYDIESNTTEKIFTLSDSGLPSSAAEYIFPDGEGGFIFAGIDLRSSDPVITAVSQKEIPSSENARKEITAAGLYSDISTEIEYQTAEFNRTSPDIKVSLKKYRTEDELSADMLAGQLKDIILSGDTDIGNGNFISKGVYADMGEFMDNDGELSREDFIPNVINAFERDGKLYTFTDSFMVQTALCKNSFAKDKQSMTFDDIDKIAAELPAGTEIFPGCDKNTLLYDLLTISGNRFIDRKSGSCSFDSEDFTGLLKFADKHGLSEVDDNYFENFDLFNTFSEESGIMLITYLTDFRDIHYYEHNMFNSTLSAAGIPCMSGTGSAIDPNTVFGINASSGNAEDCWKYIRTLLRPEYQDHTSSFPVRKDSFEKKSKEAIEKTPDQNEDYYVLCSIGYMMYGLSPEFNFKIEQSDADKISDAVYSAKVLSFADSKITEIITEEASAFFSGAKTAEEAAAMIQNRVTLYLSE